MQIVLFLVGVIGAFFHWMLSGFKGELGDYIPKTQKNIITGLAIMFGLAAIIYLVMKSFQIPFSDLQKPISH
jgi:hypothetical protein